MKTHAWQRTSGALVFIPVLTLAMLYYGIDAMFIASIFIYISIALTITSGYHRYFSHATYICSPVWEFIYGFIGTASLNSSPVEWASVHIAHHKYSDTDSDPYDSTWRQFFNFKDRTGIKLPKLLLPLLKNETHRFWLECSGSVALGTAIITLILGFKVFVFFYLLPVSAYLFTSYSHNILAHIGKKPRDMYLLELIVPMMGEWLHGSHHAKPKQSVYSNNLLFDFGGFFIKVIRHDSK